ncbi:MAG: hypothetical protein HEQ23_01710 [Tepidisphaera sp.]
MERSRDALVAGLTLTLAASALAQPSFTGIGDLAGGARASYAQGISPDGTIVVGRGTIAGNLERAFVRRNGTLTALSDPAGVYSLESANAVTDRGVIVGSASGPNGQEAFKYNLSGPNRFRALGGGLAGGLGSTAYAVSRSGSLVVGVRDAAEGAREAALWIGPEISGLGWLSPQPATSVALGISADDSTIVGGSDGELLYRAFVLRDDVLSPLEELADMEFSEARGVNGDGSVIVGSANVPGRSVALAWINGVANELPELAGGFNFASATACNEAGTVIVGFASGEDGVEAVVWRNSEVRTLRQILDDAGVTTHVGWSLSLATGISADGLTICGIGINPNNEDEGWVATIGGEPCPADFNGDDFVDFFDYDAYVGCFEGGECPPGRTADFNGDDFVDFFDYDAFVSIFEAGC